MGRKKAESQPISKPNPAPEPSAQQSPETPAVSPSASTDGQQGPEDQNGPETQNMSDSAPVSTFDADVEYDGGFVAMLKAAYELSDNPEEKEAILELIGLVEASPEMEGQFIKLLGAEMLRQLKAVNITPTLSEEDIVAMSFRMTYELSQLEIGSDAYNAKVAEIEAAGISLKAQPETTIPWDHEADRAERIRANANAELDIMKEASRKRQEAAEALAEDAQEDRREA